MKPDPPVTKNDLPAIWTTGGDASAERMMPADKLDAGRVDPDVTRSSCVGPEGGSETCLKVGGPWSASNPTNSAIPAP